MKCGEKKATTHGVLIRLSDEEHAALRLLGGTPYVRRHLQRVRSGDETVTVRPYLLSEEDRAAFMEGVRDSGGLLSAFPFGRSRSKEEISVSGLDPRQWGAQWYRKALERGSLY